MFYFYFTVHSIFKTVLITEKNDKNKKKELHTGTASINQKKEVTSVEKNSVNNLNHNDSISNKKDKDVKTAGSDSSAKNATSDKDLIEKETVTQSSIKTTTSKSEDENM